MNDQALAQLTIEKMLKRWPETAAVFQKRQMACAGCVVAPFYTVSDAADIYGIPLADLLHDLRAAIEAETPQDSAKAQ